MNSTIEKLPLQISDETLAQTTRCPHNFQCLTADTKDMCKIESHIQGNVLHIKKCVHVHCPYKKTFGYSYIVETCTCPTRCEIYKHYKI